MLKINDFVWVKKCNEKVPDNIEYWHFIYYNGECSRRYRIIPIYSHEILDFPDLQNKPELYAYFESIGVKSEDVPGVDIDNLILIDGYIYKEEKIRGVFETIDDAKYKAYQDYFNSFVYPKSLVF